MFGHLITIGIAQSVFLAGIPTSLDGLEIAPFKKKMPYLVRHENQVEKIAKRAKCEFPTNDQGWVDTRIDAAVSFDEKGSVKDVIPVSVNCPELEEFVVSYFKKYGRKNGPALTGDQWFRTAMFFRWPG